MDDPSLLRFRCHAGHAFSAAAVMAGRGAEVDKMLERTLWSQQERAYLARRLAQDARRLNQAVMLADNLDARVKNYDEDAALIRRLARPSETAEPDEV
jgi:two-component system chemotaxis response regulator CheB